jgi:trans-aconitate 2-methyltransferase
MAHTWDPERYLAYADERGRPFVELLARIGAADPASVVDLGCGPGNLTRLLTERWPAAQVTGLDSSAAMIEKARTAGGPVAYEVADVRDWATAAAPGSVDVLVSNATFQWVPGHLDLLPALVRAVRPGGWFAFQVPGNFTEPSHRLREELAAEPPYAAHTVGLDAPASHDPAVYLETLAGAGCEVDAWETTYLHVLTGDDPVFTWISGTILLPTRAALPDELWEPFAVELKRRLAAAYPVRHGRVVMPFRRIFAVARVAS